MVLGKLKHVFVWSLSDVFSMISPPTISCLLWPAINPPQNLLVQLYKNKQHSSPAQHGVVCSQLTRGIFADLWLVDISPKLTLSYVLALGVLTSPLVIPADKTQDDSPLTCQYRSEIVPSQNMPNYGVSIHVTIIDFWVRLKYRAAFLPGMQMQVNSPLPSMHVPRFWHGLESHSLTFISHLGPV